MFAVVYKNRVIVGPMEWNRGIFEGSLEREGIQITLPRTPPDMPFTINENARICLTQENRPEINPLTNYHYGPLWDVSGDVAIANFEIHDTPLDNVKGNYKQVAAFERWRKEIKGINVTIQDTSVYINTEKSVRDVFIQKYLSMNDGDTVNWKFNEGWLTLSKAEVKTIADAINQYIQDCFDWEKEIVEQIESKDNASDIAAIEIVKKEEPTSPS